MTQQILIVEDEQKIARVLSDYLKQAGFTPCILARGDAVMPAIARQMPDLILLDIMLPGLDGMEVCRKVRRRSNVPIIMITARAEEVDRLIGLELGADDYICKPFSPREVVARVKAVLRRLHPRQTARKLVAGPLELELEQHRATVGGRRLHLTPSEFGLLALMMRRPGRVFSRGELIRQVLGYDFDGYDRTVDSHVKNLRKKIADTLPGHDIIQTVYGIGYKIAAD